MRTAPVGGTRGQNSLEPQNFQFFASGIFLLVGSLTNKNQRNGPQPPPKKNKRPYLGPQGHMGPQTGFTGSPFSMRSHLVEGRFAQNGPQDPSRMAWQLLFSISGPLALGNCVFSVFRFQSAPGTSLSAKGRPGPKWPEIPAFRVFPPVGVRSVKT